MVLTLKACIAVLCLAAYLIVDRSSYIHTLPRRRFHTLLAGLWIATRLGLFCLIFLVLKMDVTSDVANAYYPEGQQAALGKMIYRDFDTSYAPAFPYIIGLIISVWHSPKAIVLMATIFEGLGCAIWLRVMRRLYSEREYRRIALFYVLSAFMILNAVVAGQNQVWVSLLLAIAVLQLTRGQALLAGAIAGIPAVVVKFLSLLYVPAFIRRGSRPLLMGCVALSIPVVVYTTLALNGIDIFLPVRIQGSRITSGNLPYLLSAFVPLQGRTNIPVPQICAAVILLSVSLYLVSRPVKSSGREAVLSAVILTLSCGLVNDKFFSTYLAMAFMPIVAVAAAAPFAPHSALGFGLFNLVISLEPSLWSRWLHGKEYNSQLWQVIPRMQAAGEIGQLAIFLGVELVMLGFYVIYLTRAWKCLRADPGGAAVAAAWIETRTHEDPGTYVRSVQMRLHGSKGMGEL